MPRFHRRRAPPSRPRPLVADAADCALDTCVLSALRRSAAIPVWLIVSEDGTRVRTQAVPPGCPHDELVEILTEAEYAERTRRDARPQQWTEVGR